ncbi:MAG TPA: PAS domain-containing sensor histidine kinase [Kofleriaceae bacterium]|nr:PAS domain-containing sensor histidine kinase [Kofleriaceae bacterium]
MSSSPDGVAAAELYRELHDHVRDILLVIVADTGAIVEANLAAVRAYGYTRDELLARTIYDLRIETPPSVGAQMRAADRAGFLFETEHRRKDGSTFPVEVSSRGETFGERRYLLSIIRDITERRRAERERERLLATTQQALAMREEFLWVASHELRTPLTVVSLLLHQLRRAIDRGDASDRLAASTDTALSHVERLSALVGRLLDASQLEGGPRLDLSDVDLGEVARAAVERVRAQSDAAGVEIVLEVPAIHGRWDAVRLEQVLMNLLANAVKYGLRQPIRVVARMTDAIVHVEVIDHGIGLAASETERIFGKFERAVSTAHYGGLGLGLYIARQIVEAHRGTIAVESTPGRGSTFRVSLPLDASAAT